MEPIAFPNDSDYICYAKNCGFGSVYPLSVAQKFQQGEIFADFENDRTTVLFWHYCGFAFLSGAYDKGFLDSLYEMILDKNKIIPRRFLLFTDDERIESYFGSKENFGISKRYFFEYHADHTVSIPDLPEGFEIQELDSVLLSRLKGRITPSVFWQNAEMFLSKGKGYCIVNGDAIASWAFTSAVSDREVDIGVETDDAYRHRGFARIAVQTLIRYIMDEQKLPVWACHSHNPASQRLAEKIGFTKVSECSVIQYLNADSN